MSVPIPPNLSLWEKSHIVAAICRALGTGLYAFFLSPFRGPSGAKTVSKHVKLAVAKSLMKNMTVAQSQYMIPSLDSVYPAYAKQKGFKPEIVTMKNGIKGYWFGDAEWGGYSIPANAGHLHFASAIIDNAGNGKNLAILMPGYTLAPQAIYPTQLEQGVESVRYVLEKREPGKVMLAGDSAGANLALAILSHILHPHPSAIPPLTLVAPLKGAIFLSPWWSFATDWPCFVENEPKDSVAAEIGDLWSANFLGGKARDVYNEPIRAEQAWWEGLRGSVEEMFVVGGMDEVLLDSIRVMARRLERAHPRTQTLLVPNEYHDQPVLINLDTPGTGLMAEGIYAWVRARLAASRLLREREC